MKKYVLYHGSCPDGFGAAYAAWTVLGDDATYTEVNYNEPLPSIEDGSEVYIVDFSYSREILLELAGRCSKVVVLDHHKTAQETLVDLDHSLPNLRVQFDMEQSGAILSWHHFHYGTNPPGLLLYVQDRDLWQWKLPYSKEISAALRMEPKTFQRWDEISRSFRGNEAPESLYYTGAILLKSQKIQVESLASKAEILDVGGHKVPVLNSPSLQSELGDELCRLHPDSPFAGIYFCNSTTEFWSLRSRNGFDVSVVAKKFGGGGHPAAAGFRKERPKEIPHLKEMEAAYTKQILRDRASDSWYLEAGSI